MVARPSLFVGVQVNFLILSGLLSGGRNIVTVFNDTAKAQVRSLRKVGMPLAKIASELGLNLNTGVRIVFWTVLDYRLVVVSVLFYGYSAEG